MTPRRELGSEVGMRDETEVELGSGHAPHHVDVAGRKG
jgi:hypothetical protein